MPLSDAASLREYSLVPEGTKVLIVPWGTQTAKKVAAVPRVTIFLLSCLSRCTPESGLLSSLRFPEGLRRITQAQYNQEGYNGLLPFRHDLPLS